MKKFVIAITLAMVFLTLLSTTVFAQPQVINPEANINATWGQSVKEYGATDGTQGEQASALATNDFTPGAAAEVHQLRGDSGIYEVPPPFEP